MTKAIIFNNPNGTNVCLCIPSGEIDISAVLAKDCPSGSIIVDTESLPPMDIFFDAWELNESTVTVNLTKAKQIGHNFRRQKREEEFAPLDSLIMKQIPGTNFTEVESQRQAIRDKYTTVQNEIDSAPDTDTLKTILNTL